MSLLLIVLLLDESHLELVEDVLKETNFNNKDWKQLERELNQVYTMTEDRMPAQNLKTCLRKWLSSYWPPSLDELADALDRIGYSKAGKYIIKTCKLIIMFNDQCY